MFRLYPEEIQPSGQPRSTPASPRRARRSTRSVQRMSWRSPRCNVGAGPAQIPRHPSAPRGGCLEARPMPKEGDYCGLRTSLGPSCREHQAGWELKVGATPSCVWSQALSSRGQREHLHGKAGPGRSADGGPGCSALDTPGVSHVICPGFQLGAWAQGAATSVPRAGVASAASAL